MKFIIQSSWTVKLTNSKEVLYRIFTQVCTDSTGSPERVCLQAVSRQWWWRLYWQVHSVLSFSLRMAALQWSSSAGRLIYSVPDPLIQMYTQQNVFLGPAWVIFLFILEPLYLWLIKLTSNITKVFCVFSIYGVSVVRILDLHCQSCHFTACSNPPGLFNSPPHCSQKSYWSIQYPTDCSLLI